MQRLMKAFLFCFFICIAIARTATAEIESRVTTGQVVDDRGRPVEGAEIMIVPNRHTSVFSNSRGQFEITWNPRSWRSGDTVFYVVARHKTSGLGVAMPIEQKLEDLRLAMKPGVSLSGRIVDTEGKVISGVRLSIKLRASRWSATIGTQRQTDENGNFTFNAIPVENRYQFNVGADGYGQKDIFFDTGDAADGRLDMGRIELPVANMSVSGRVVDIHGHPVPGLEVFCFGEGQPSCNTFSDEKGYFELRGVCAGLVRFMAEGRVLNKWVSRQVIMEAGARDVKVVVKEGGNARSYYVRTKTHEEIINSGNPFIAGRVVDVNETAVAEVPVNVRCIQKKDEQGRDTESYFHSVKYGDVTDQQGRFAIELEEKATYSLLFSPTNHAAMIVYDLVTNTKDLEVILPNGGTLTGQIVRFSRGEKVPVPDAKVEFKQMSRLSYSHIGYDRDRKTTTDSEGRFRFDHIRTLIRNVRQRSAFEPRIWELSYGDTSQTVKFLPGETVKHLDLIVHPDLTKATSLTGKPLPDYTGIDIDVNQNRFTDKRFLICFFDYAQRPSRHCILDLNSRLAQLQKQGLEIIAVQTSKAADNELKQWIKKMNISVPVSILTGDIDETRFIWNVQSLPWLILTDRNHVVTAEGFGIVELDAKIKEVDSSEKTPVDSNEVAGLVKGPDGRVLSGVRVTEFQTDKDYTTDDDGIFVSAFGPSNERRFFFAVDKRRKLVGVGRVTPGERHVEITLSPAEVVSGTVVDPDGKPVAGAQVAPLPMTNFYVLTDKQGQFDVAWLPSWEPGEGLYLMVRHKDLNLAALPEITEDTKTMKVRLVPALTLTGTVEDPNGVPIPGAHVGLSLRRGWACDTPVKKVTTDQRGCYEFDALPQKQEYIHYADAEGFWRNQITTGVINRTVAREAVGPIVLKRPVLSVSGIVVHADGKAVANIPVHLRGEGQPYLDAQTDAEGRFTFEKVCCGPVEVSTKNDVLFGKIETEGGTQNVKVVVRPRFQ